MMNITEIVQTSGWKNFMAKLYGFGATVVIIGALFKINHWPGGTIVITTGLIVEAVIFFFSAFEPLHEELDWTLVYPELVGMSDPDEIENFKEQAAIGSERSIDRIEDVLGGSGVDNEALSKLGQGFENLNRTANSLSDLSKATVATSEFVENMRNASSSISGIQETYSSTAETLKTSASSLTTAYSETAESIKSSGVEIADSYKEIAENIKTGQSSILQGNKEYEEQLSKLSTNLGSLNAVYEEQIKESSARMKGTEEVYTGLQTMIQNLKESVDETNQYKEEMAKLKSSISSLNSIYGNMLNSMSDVSKK